MPSLTITIDVEYEHVSGRFASKEDVAAELMVNLDNPGEVSGIGAEGNTTYEITMWEVS